MWDFIDELLEIIFGLCVAILGAVQDICTLIASRSKPDEGNLCVVIDDGETQVEIPVSRLGEFILEEPQNENSGDAYQVTSFPLMDALDFKECPSDEEVQGVKPGCKTLLAANNESFWVGVTKVSDGFFEGLIEGNPTKSGYQRGEAIEFAGHHIFQIHHTAQAL